MTVRKQEWLKAHRLIPILLRGAFDSLVHSQLRRLSYALWRW